MKKHHIPAFGTFRFPRGLLVLSSAVLSGVSCLPVEDPAPLRNPEVETEESPAQCPACGRLKPPGVEVELAEKLAEARKIIAAHQQEILKTVIYTAAEMKGTKEEFREYYREEVLPCLVDIAKRIKPSAIHWVDMDWDQKDELLFWTEGLAPSGWGPKEYLFIIRLQDDGTSEIVCSRRLEYPSRGASEYQHVRFWKYPTAMAGCNDNVRAVLSYASYGCSASTFYTLEINWNMYKNQLEIDEIKTSFPVAVDGL